MSDGADAHAAAAVVEPIAERDADSPAPAVRFLLPPIMPLVVSLLEELRVPSEAVECTLLPAVDQYAIRLPASRAMGGAVLLPRRALEQALVDPTARARVRNLLQTWVETTGARRAAGEAGLLASYFSALDVGSRPGPRCVRCGGPLLAEDAVAVYEASRWHLVCPPAW